MRAQLNGKRIWFDTIGPSLPTEGAEIDERPTIVALHGGPGIDHSSVRGSVEPLADLAQIVLIDQCGHGRSDYGEPSMWTIESWAADVAEFCDALEIKRPILFGSSFGAMVALATAGMFPDLPSALVVSNSSGGLTDHVATVEAFRRLGGDEVAAIAWRWLEDLDDEADEAFDEFCVPFYGHRPGAREHAAAMFSRAIRTPELGQHFQSMIKTLKPEKHAAAVRCRTLIMCGTDDVMVPQSLATELHQMFAPSIARLEFVPEAGHFLYRDNPEHAYRVLRAFINQLADEPG